MTVVDARMHTAAAASGRREPPARLTVRIRATNEGRRRAALDRPTLRIGRVIVQTDPQTDAPGARFEPLTPGTTQTVTLRFSVAGEAKAKIVRDRRARILVAGQSVPIRVKLRSPAR
ncbi:MAG: hypothetical protein M3376_07580 [Actinomycetota bacterium]|nr:hypothetical protein [Actinomycetota bacterium]